LAYPVFAASVYVTYHSLDSFTYTFGPSSGLPQPFNVTHSGHYYSFTADSSYVAYCIDRTNQEPGGTQNVIDANWDGLDELTKKRLSLALLYGYDGDSRYGFPADVERVATQIVVWLITHNIMDTSIESLYLDHSISGSYRDAVLNVCNIILRQIKSHYTIPYFTSTSSATTQIFQAGFDVETKLHTVTLNDINGVLSQYNLKARLQQAGYGVSGSGNQITVTSSVPFDETKVISSWRISNTNVSSLLIKDISYLTGTNVQAKVMLTGIRHQPPNVNTYLKLRSGRGRIVIIKTDSETNEPVAGAEFEIIDINGESVGTVITDETGTARVENLVFGEYFINETSPAYGYIPNETEHYVILAQNEISLRIENDYKKGRVEIIKTSSFDGSLLQGAVYGLYRSEDDKLMQELKTSSNGKVVSELYRFGSYYLLEIDAPARYQKDSKKHQLIIGEVHESTSVLKITNAPIIGIFSVLYTPDGSPKLYVGDNALALDVPDTGVEYCVTDEMILGYPKAPLLNDGSAEGIEITPNENILIADTPEEMVQIIDFCVKNVEKCEEIGKNAKKLIENRYNQEIITKDLMQVFTL